MTMFRELLKNPGKTDPTTLQAAARSAFPSEVRNSRLELRSRSASVPDTPMYVIIGVASYSPKELELLDELNDAPWPQGTRVATFDVTDCQHHSDFDEFAPEIGAVMQTPVIALYKHGKVQAKQSGLFMTRDVLQENQLLK